MKKALFSALTLALLYGCASTPVEESKPAEPSVTPGLPAAPPLAGRPIQPSAPQGDALPDRSKRSVFYEYDKYDIKDEYRPIVESHAKYLRENPGAKMLIQGNADERGSREYNLGLGQRRADSVKRALTLLGAKESQIESVSLGEEKPVCTEHAEDCWAKNRRADMLYSGEY